jgi:hypothetical protein
VKPVGDMNKKLSENKLLGFLGFHRFFTSVSDLKSYKVAVVEG